MNKFDKNLEMLTDEYTCKNCVHFQERKDQEDDLCKLHYQRVSSKYSCEDLTPINTQKSKSKTSEKSCGNCDNYFSDAGHGGCQIYKYYMATTEEQKSHAKDCVSYAPTVNKLHNVEVQNDPTNPAHYTQGKIECIDAIEAALSPEEFRGFLKGNVFKYMWRHDKKNGLEDVEKGKWYYERLLKVLQETNQG